jgi:hypothetical protein
VEQEGIVCSECKTLNEPGWSFCQQCGKRLTKAAPSPPPQPPAASGIPDSLRTVPEQHAVIDPGVVQGLRTNPEPQPAEQGRKTVVPQQPPPLEHSFKTVADDRPRVVEAKVVPRPPLPTAPPTVVDQPPTEPREREPDDSPMRTVPVETPVQLKPTAPIPTPPVQQKPLAATPPPPVAKLDTPPPSSTPPTRPPEPKTVAHGGAMSGVLCTQCGQSNSFGSAFCASCGAPITFGKTMVIASQPAPPKGRLHLVMEGGQPGEVYELEEDTVIGRSTGKITFPHDGFMSGRHARIERRGSSFILTDEDSRNGTFIKTKGEVELKSGDMILVGKQLFRFEA